MLSNTYYQQERMARSSALKSHTSPPFDPRRKGAVLPFCRFCKTHWHISCISARLSGSDESRFSARTRASKFVAIQTMENRPPSGFHTGRGRATRRICRCRWKRGTKKQQRHHDRGLATCNSHDTSVTGVELVPAMQWPILGGSIARDGPDRPQ